MVVIGASAGEGEPESVRCTERDKSKTTHRRVALVIKAKRVIKEENGMKDVGYSLLNTPGGRIGSGKELVPCKGLRMLPVFERKLDRLMSGEATIEASFRGLDERPTGS